MSYVVLARKWRPMAFSDLVGQDHVAATLGNAIKNGRVAHAFLFTGVRGVGKTTSARIMAKALNCLKSDGPTATPCLQCAACKEIADGTDVDVQEIDGASYNGVDEVRRLQESMPYRPSRDRYKIYIVDEVHMLSQSAWNAFLKTLEEPPPHVKFIFATTEVHKVPITILSRVQRFDFKLIPTRLIMQRLNFVLGEENVEAEEAALAIIAREAAGSMRDAMSLLDQVIAWSDEKLTEQGVTSVLGVASRKVLYDITAQLLAAECSPLLRSIGELANQGFDMSHVARDLLSVLRDVVVAASSDSPDQLLDLPDDERNHVQALAEHPVDDLLRLHQGFSHSYDDVVRSSQPRAALEMLLVRLARRPPLVPIDDLVERLIRLEKRLHGAARPGGGGHAPTSAPPRAGSGRGAPSSPTRRTSNEDSPPATPKAAVRRPATTSARRETPSPEPRNFSPPADVDPPPALASLDHQPDESEAEPKPNESSPAATPRRAAVERPALATANEPKAPLPKAPPANFELAAPARDWDDCTLVERWRLVVDRLRDDDPKLGAFLDHATVVEASRQKLHVQYERGGVVDIALQDRTALQNIAVAARSVTGTEPELIAEVVAERLNGSSVFAVDKQTRLDEEQAALAEARNHPMLQEAVRVLGARVKHIELPKD